jgi:putative transposase
MKRSYFTSEQIVFALRQAESGTSVAEICRKMGIVEQTFYRWEMGSGSISPFMRL